MALDILARTSKKQDMVNLAIERIKIAESKLASNALQAQDTPLWDRGSNKSNPPKLHRYRTF